MDVLRAGNKQIPKDDESLILLIQDALIEVAQKTEPLVLITLDNELKIIKVLEDGLYLREPKQIIDDNSLIEIDTDLIKAVAHIVISSFSDNDNFVKHKTHANKYINDYNWARFESFNKENDLLAISRKAVDFHGFKKIYVSKYKTSKGTSYDWDESFISKLESFFAGHRLNLSKSDINNIDNFILFADNIMTSQHEDYGIIDKFDKYLGEL